MRTAEEPSLLRPVAPYVWGTAALPCGGQEHGRADSASGACAIGECRFRIAIYCMHEREPSALNTEHVVPRAFGMFEQNLTLDCACIECYGYFGKTVEVAYGRDSVEGFLRVFHGTKPADEAGDRASAASRSPEAATPTGAGATSS